MVYLLFNYQLITLLQLLHHHFIVKNYVSINLEEEHLSYLNTQLQYYHINLINLDRDNFLDLESFLIQLVSLQLWFLYVINIFNILSNILVLLYYYVIIILSKHFIHHYSLDILYVSIQLGEQYLQMLNSQLQYFHLHLIVRDYDSNIILVFFHFQIISLQQSFYRYFIILVYDTIIMEYLFYYMIITWLLCSH